MSKPDDIYALLQNYPCPRCGGDTLHRVQTCTACGYEHPAKGYARAFRWASISSAWLGLPFGITLDEYLHAVETGEWREVDHYGEDAKPHFARLTPEEVEALRAYGDPKATKSHLRAKLDALLDPRDE